MKKLTLNFVALACCLCLVSWKKPDYRPAFGATKGYITDLTKKGLLKFTGNQTLTDVGAHLNGPALDTINKYVEPINSFKISASYRTQKEQRAIRALSLSIYNAITRYEKEVSNTKLSSTKWVFALKVLIGLKTGLLMPLQGVGDLPSRDTIIKHDIFVDSLEKKNVKDSIAFSYSAYLGGFRVAQAKGDPRMIAFYMNQAYDEAGREVAVKLDDIFFQLAYPAPPGSINEPVGDDGEFGVTDVPGQEPFFRYGYAQFPGSDVEMKKFFNDHLVYPKKEWEQGIEGLDYASFIVEKDGSISNIKIKFGVSPAIDSEVVRVLKLSPKWRPMEITGKGVLRSETYVSFYFLIYVDDKRTRNLELKRLKTVVCSKLE